MSYLIIKQVGEIISQITQTVAYKINNKVNVLEMIQEIQ